jgi:hypothetical protein
LVFDGQHSDALVGYKVAHPNIGPDKTPQWLVIIRRNSSLNRTELAAFGR